MPPEQRLVARVSREAGAARSDARNAQPAANSGKTGAANSSTGVAQGFDCSRTGATLEATKPATNSGAACGRGGRFESAGAAELVVAAALAATELLEMGLGRWRRVW